MRLAGKLTGKTALITGGGTGIGLGAALALGREGAKVAIAGRREEPLVAAAKAWDAAEPLLYHAVDVSNRQSVNELFAWAVEKLGKIDIFVNSSGTNIRTRTMADMTPEQWDEVIGINATGAYNCLHAVLPRMREAGDGLIVNISSIAGKRAAALGGIAYCASKFAMTALGIAAGNEESKHGIRITNVYPGEVNTPILDRRPTPVTDEHKASILQPEDVGELVAALACLPPRAHVPEVVIKPTHHAWV
jgi:NAD(P)-dependent dehydrogenase (short-subunit alcohol dehydrogenase family)